VGIRIDNICDRDGMMVGMKGLIKSGGKISGKKLPTTFYGYVH
jgi:hypothetical protein